VIAFSDLGTNFGPSTSERFSLRLGNLAFAPFMVEAAIDQRRRFVAGATVGWSESPWSANLQSPTVAAQQWSEEL
jgi:hypothetical protein